MGRRLLSAVLAGGMVATVLGVSASTSHATVSAPIESALTVSTDHIYRRDGLRYPLSVTGDVRLAADLPCGPCQLRIGIWAPGADAPWRSEFFEGLSPGQALSDVAVDAVVYGGSALGDGVHEVWVQVRDALGTLLASLTAAELDIYQLVQTPHVTVPRARLQGRRVAVRCSLPWLAADGYREPYDGKAVPAAVFRSTGPAWRLAVKSALSRNHPRRRFDETVRWTTRWRLVVTTPTGDLASRPVRVRVWRETGAFALRRVRVDTSRVRTAGLVELSGRALAFYEDGQWHAPVPGTEIAVQFRGMNSRHWRSVKRRPVEGRRFSAEASPWATGYWRVKLPGETSRPVLVTVR